MAATPPSSTEPTGPSQAAVAPDSNSFSSLGLRQQLFRHEQWHQRLLSRHLEGPHDPEDDRYRQQQRALFQPWPWRECQHQRDDHLHRQTRSDDARAVVAVDQVPGHQAEPVSGKKRGP